MAEPLRVATGHGSTGLFHDEQELPAAFAKHGYEIQPQHWMDIGPEGPPVLVRTAWDYTQNADRFHAWLHELEAAGTPCINPPATMRWNMDKRYLLDLQRKGHRIVPTRVMESYSTEAAVALAAAEGWRDAIAKPVIGGGAEGLVRIRDGEARPFNLQGNTWAADASPVPTGACLVQPFMPSIHEGEWSLFVFGGQLSHAIRKIPAPGDIRVQEEHGGRTTPAEAPRRLIDAALDVVADVDAPIARVDGVEVDGELLLMELELIEPELYLRYAPGASERVAYAVASALRE